MINLTKPQRKSLYRVYVRTLKPTASRQLTYREFRRAVQPAFDCAMINAYGMWLGIERDGYTHS